MSSTPIKDYANKVDQLYEPCFITFEKYIIAEDPRRLSMFLGLNIRRLLLMSNEPL